MNTILISYDLQKPETRSDYERLKKYIKDYGYWAKPLESLWIVKTDKTTSQVRDEIINLVDPNDKIFVINVSGDGWASYDLSSEVTEWLKNNL